MTVYLSKVLHCTSYCKVSNITTIFQSTNRHKAILHGLMTTRSCQMVNDVSVYFPDRMKVFMFFGRSSNSFTKT